MRSYRRHGRPTPECYQVLDAVQARSPCAPCRRGGLPGGDPRDRRSALASRRRAPRAPRSPRWPTPTSALHAAGELRQGDASIVVAGRPASIAYLRFRVAVPAGSERPAGHPPALRPVEVDRRLHRPPRREQRLGRDHAHLCERPADRRAAPQRRPAPFARTRTSRSTSPRSSPGAASSASRVKGRGGLAARVQVARVRLRPATARRQTSAAASRRGRRATAHTGPCGTAAGPPRRIDHVIWIWMENKPYDAVIGSPSAPYENQLAAACGLATNYHAIAHPSLPNYIAATSGDTQGIADDDPPSSHPLGVASIFSQVKDAGKTWREYAESAPGPCSAHLERGVRGQARPGRLLHGHPRRLRRLGRADGHDGGRQLPDRPHGRHAARLLVRHAGSLQRHARLLRRDRRRLAPVVVREDPRVADVPRRQHGRLRRLGRERRLGDEPGPADRRQPVDAGRDPARGRTSTTTRC